MQWPSRRGTGIRQMAPIPSTVSGSRNGKANGNCFDTTDWTTEMTWSLSACANCYQMFLIQIFYFTCIHYSLPDKEAKYCDKHICECVGVYVYMRTCLGNHMSKLYQIFCDVACAVAWSSSGCIAIHYVSMYFQFCEGYHIFLLQNFHCDVTHGLTPLLHVICYSISQGVSVDPSAAKFATAPNFCQLIISQKNLARQQRSFLAAKKP